jgi:energy-converting hydrogenase Eha subunit E
MTESSTAPSTGSRAETFEAAVADRKMKTGRPGGDRALRILSVVLLVVGVVGTFLAYNNSLELEDSRNIASNQILAVAFLAVTVAGAALFVVAGIAAVLRLWLLRQLVESQARADEIAELLRRR